MKFPVMKYDMAAASLLLLFGIVANGISHSAAVSGRGGSGKKLALGPHDVADCAGAVGDVFAGATLAKVSAIEKVVDKCAVSKRIDDNNYVCTHLQEALDSAFAYYAADQTFTPEQFCGVAEDYMLTVRGASRMPGVGSGPLLSFKLMPTCPQSISATFAVNQTTVLGKDAPDVWYNLCANAGCQHFLPSRTRWCKIDRSPTHSIRVCEDLRGFLLKQLAGQDMKQLDPTAMCNVYGEFAFAVGINIQSYEHVIHLEDSKGIPSPIDHARALRSSRLVNAADAHKVRDGVGQTPSYSTAVQAARISSLRHITCLLGSLLVLSLV
jgi:hypothetical protein